MSTSAPAGMANRNIGRLFATCTIETMNGSGSRLVISQPEATLYIQPPMFETTVAVQITANALWRNGAQAELAAGGGGEAGGLFAVGGLIPVDRAEGEFNPNPLARSGCSAALQATSSRDTRSP